jgi:phenylalanyl-tRNA synthetase beta chain
MRVPLSWLGELVDLAPARAAPRSPRSLVSVGLEEEALHGGDITGPLVVGRVLTFEEQIQKNGKPIRFCTVDVGPPRAARHRRHPPGDRLRRNELRGR